MKKLAKLLLILSDLFFAILKRLLRTSKKLSENKKNEEKIYEDEESFIKNYVIKNLNPHKQKTKCFKALESAANNTAKKNFNDLKEYFPILVEDEKEMLSEKYKDFATVNNEQKIFIHLKENRISKLIEMGEYYDKSARKPTYFSRGMNCQIFLNLLKYTKII